MRATQGGPPSDPRYANSYLEYCNHQDHRTILDHRDQLAGKRRERALHSLDK